MQIRKYTSSDFDKVLGLFDVNTPEYFSPSERKDLIFYLENELEDYFVLEVENSVLAAGGINYSQNQANISWDFVHPDAHGKGFGSAILKHRIQHIQSISQDLVIKVRTSQLAFGFYEKNGFKTTNTEKDYWAIGYDLVEMKLVRVES